MNKNHALVSAAALALLNNAWLAVAADETNGGWTTTLVDGLNLTYPKSFQKTAIGPSSDNKDNLLKVSGLAGASYLELAVSKLDLPQEMSLETSIKSLDEIVFSKLPGFKSNGFLRSVSPYKRAVEREITFKHADIEFFQKQAFIKNGDTKLLTLTGPLKSQAAAGSVWQAALSSLSSPAPTTTFQNPYGAGTQNKASERHYLPERWTSKDGRLSITFPSNLKEKVQVSDDHCLQAVQEEAGKVIGLDIYRGESGDDLNLGQISEILEEKYFSTLKDYQKIKEEPRPIGDSGSLSSIVRESTFETNGRKVHHLSAYIKDEKGAKVYAICLTTAGLNHNEANQIWSSIITSVRLKQ
ncbi:MAG: hypothetical protein J0M35_21295 [Candidatus Obscuribacter phosphatis]|uniref:PsbP C-terminal domain-containing protein n=1 Tax=Candidatus Obscuribacter phosphatis TaxID=1906157 RepID=A0A8J7TPA8_9BACT|nr:hypothetical protein [Candidatus Obscuribacter phosphatis]